MKKHPWSERKLHFPWPKTIAEARALQVRWKDRIKLLPLKKLPELVAGVDAAFLDDKVIAAACLFRYPDMAPLEEASAIRVCSFPYRPGFLSFREGPAIIEALWRLKTKPDLILFDGQGIAHPRRMGIAAFIGVLLDAPAIGCAKSRLVGEFQEPGRSKGEWTALRYRGQTIGAVLRTKNNVRPVFVSPGHKMNLRSSIQIVLSCAKKYRIPEPLRAADSLAKRIASKYRGKSSSG